MIADVQSLGVYFIDQYNFPNLCDRARGGDELSRHLVSAIMQFVNEAPQPICAMCGQPVGSPDIPSMTIVIIRAENACLTSWICEDCSTRDDLDDQIEKVIRGWPAIPKDAVVEILKKHTVH